MPSLFACLGCGGGAESDDIRVLDYRHAALTDVPSDVFASERTLEELLLDSNQVGFWHQKGASHSHVLFKGITGFHYNYWEIYAYKCKEIFMGIRVIDSNRIQVY